MDRKTYTQALAEMKGDPSRCAGMSREQIESARLLLSRRRAIMEQPHLTETRWISLNGE